VNEPILTPNPHVDLINLQNPAAIANAADRQTALINLEANRGHHIPTILNAN
jgi:hypothetical protein